MAKQNPPLLAFNRGLLSPKALARVDLDRTQMSAEVMTNWLPKTQGAMTIRPGTKYLGSSLNDTGAEFIEFVAATDDLALLELTHQKMRVWLRDTGNAWETPAGDVGLDVPLSRPKVATTVTLSDTGWSNASTGGAVATAASDVIPTTTGGDPTNDVWVTASSQNVSSGATWRVADDSFTTFWQDTGAFNNTLPSWLNVNFNYAGNDTGGRKAITSYSIRSGSASNMLDNAPRRWSLITGNYDTGTFAIDTGKWTLEDTQGSETDWAVSEKRVYTLPGADTGTVEARRHWRLYFTQVDTGVGDRSLELDIAEIEMFTATTVQQVKLQGGARVFNARSEERRVGKECRSRWSPYH